MLNGRTARGAEIRSRLRKSSNSMTLQKHCSARPWHPSNPIQGVGVSRGREVLITLESAEKAGVTRREFGISGCRCCSSSAVLESSGLGSPRGVSLCGSEG
jgi:hypothetical protein